MPNLVKTIIDKEKGYINGEDYTTFICKDFPNDVVGTYKWLFITYEGMIKVLYTSRSGNAKAFRTWATKTLFIAPFLPK